MGGKDRDGEESSREAKETPDKEGDAELDPDLICLRLKEDGDLGVAVSLDTHLRVSLVSKERRHEAAGAMIFLFFAPLLAARIMSVMEVRRALSVAQELVEERIKNARENGVSEEALHEAVFTPDFVSRFANKMNTRRARPSIYR